MLCLSRKPGEKIMIGNDICVTVIEISSHGKVRLGISAPEDVPVHRLEVWQRIREQKEQQAS